MSACQARGIQGRPTSAERVEHPPSVRVELELTEGEVQREHRVVRADRIQPKPILRPLADFSRPGHDRIVLAMLLLDGETILPVRLVRGATGRRSRDRVGVGSDELEDDAEDQRSARSQSAQARQAKHRGRH